MWAELSSEPSITCRHRSTPTMSTGSKWTCGHSESSFTSCWTWTTPSVHWLIIVESNPHLSIEKKRIELLKQSDGFSYKAAVEKSKKKLVQNCTPELEDLFARIFTKEPEDRINWVQIREHALFKKHFPVIAEASKILYSKKKADRFQEFVIRQSSIMKPPVKKKIEEVPKK